MHREQTAMHQCHTLGYHWDSRLSTQQQQGGREIGKEGWEIGKEGWIDASITSISSH